MMDEEKRIVTFMGKSGKRTASIAFKNIFDLFEVECVQDDNTVQIETRFFKNEAEAQAYAEQFAFGEKYGTV
jgi:hypothetical protein